MNKLIASIAVLFLSSPAFAYMPPKATWVGTVKEMNEKTVTLLIGKSMVKVPRKSIRKAKLKPNERVIARASLKDVANLN